MFATQLLRNLYDEALGMDSADVVGRLLWCQEPIKKIDNDTRTLKCRLAAYIACVDLDNILSYPQVITLAQDFENKLKSYDWIPFEFNEARIYMLAVAVTYKANFGDYSFTYRNLNHYMKDRDEFMNGEDYLRHELMFCSLVDFNITPHTPASYLPIREESSKMTDLIKPVMKTLNGIYLYEPDKIRGHLPFDVLVACYIVSDHPYTKTNFYSNPCLIELAKKYTTYDVHETINSLI